MKQLMYVAASLLVLSCSDKEGAMFEVEGTVRNSTAQMIYLEENTAGNNPPVIMDSAKLGKDGSFELEAHPKEETMYSLRLNGDSYPVAVFINDTKNIRLDIDLKQTTRPYSVKGSPASQAMIDFQSELSNRAQQIFMMARNLDSLSKNQAADSVLRPLLTAHQQAGAGLKNYTQQVLGKSNSPILTLYALGTFQSVAGSPSLGIPGFSESELIEILNKAGSKFPKHATLAEVRNSLKPQKAPDFTLPDVNGKPVALSSFKGKYVLVDFWASWCRPCREENPNVVAAFQQFRNRNFTILGVSLDEQKADWMQAIQNDSLAWTHVSDLKQWESMVVPLFNITEIPYNVLLDPQGTIIATNLRGPALHQKLNEVLK